MSEAAEAPADSATGYDHKAIEAKWRARWEETHADQIDVAGAKSPFYNLMMFPYPSAEGLHVGHIIPFGGADIYGRWRRLKGDDVFEPMGFDAFGIHSENYAMKIGEHPAVMMRRAVNNFRENQLKKIGSMFDWSHQVNTADPDYYKWTQWLFITLFKAGLAEWREGAVNWCPSCMTVLADEQVEQGECERCGSTVEQRYLRQWWLLITRYAQELLDGIDSLDWSDSTKIMQRNWIGRSEGGTIRFDLKGCARGDVTVFTTRPDTLYGATFLVIGADHPELESFCAPEQIHDVEQWREALPPPGDVPDFSQGIDLGSTAIHPLTGEELPVYAAPYVLGGYGTGAIMSVPAHDSRDHAFALAHDLAITMVIQPPAGVEHDFRESSYAGPGVLANSDDLDGLDWDAGKKAVIAKLEKEDRGAVSIQYKLRDWLVSRQRYWGPPIPIIHCDKCGPVPVPEKDLPVLLPDIEDFRPTGTGKSPLASVPEFVNVDCPQCGGAARRETDVLDTFVDSAWYFLRYPSVGLDDVPFDKALTDKWLPVDMYIGGNEHAVRHLLYSRFVMRALHQLGMVPTPEPFAKFRAHGMIVKDGAKMSKSRGNVVNPDEYIEKYGADVFRLYLMFLGPYTEGGDFRDQGIVGMTRFIQRVWRCALAASSDDVGDAERERRRHRAIAKVDSDISELGYNTAIATLMTFAREVDQEGDVRRIDVRTLLQLLAPFAPFVTEELWEQIGETGSIHDSSWPSYDAALAAAERVTVAIQINGKVRATIEVDAGTPAEKLTELALAQPRIQELLAGKEPKKVIPVVDRVVNIVAPQ